MRKIALLIGLTACVSEESALPWDQRIVALDDAIDAVDCGRVEIGPTCEDEPDAAQAEAVQCLIDAWQTCTPSRLEEISHTIEGGLVRRTVFVYTAEGESSCSAHVFGDYSEDPESSGIRREEVCSTVAESDGCPWFHEDDCTIVAEE